jgi:hypothetical protein
MNQAIDCYYYEAIVVTVEVPFRLQQITIFSVQFAPENQPLAFCYCMTKKHIAGCVPVILSTQTCFLKLTYQIVQWLHSGDHAAQ